MAKNGQILSLLYEKIPSVKDAALAHGYSLRNVGQPMGIQAGFCPAKQGSIILVGVHHLTIRGITSDRTGGESGGETGSGDNRKETPKTQGLESYIFVDFPPLPRESCPEDNLLKDCFSNITIQCNTNGNQ